MIVVIVYINYYSNLISQCSTIWDVNKNYFTGKWLITRPFNYDDKF